LDQLIFLGLFYEISSSKYFQEVNYYYTVYLIWNSTKIKQIGIFNSVSTGYYISTFIDFINHNI